MEERSVTEDELHAWLDGELHADRCSAVRRYLADHGLPGIALQPAAELAALDWEGIATHADIAPDPLTLALVRDLKVLDSACGSGAFLVHVLERISSIRIALGETGSLSDVRRSVLTRSIFGVDSSATAVWLCELRLWLSTVIDNDEPDPTRVMPLPNLDRQIRVGDSLTSDAFTARTAESPTSRQLCCHPSHKTAYLLRRDANE